MSPHQTVCAFTFEMIFIQTIEIKAILYASTPVSAVARGILFFSMSVCLSRSYEHDISLCQKCHCHGILLNLAQALTASQR